MSGPAARPARDGILDTACELFYAHGIHAVGVDRLIAGSGFAKATLYKKKSCIEPYEVGAPPDGPAVGRVLASAAEGFAAGDYVVHVLGRRDHAILDAATAQKVDSSLAPLPAYLGMLGTPGFTAYIGLERFTKIKESDTVFVSGAAGAIGAQVGQIAKLKGAGRVIGSAGSDAKVEPLIEEYGYDAALNYKNGPVSEQLAQAAPGGIDIFGRPVRDGLPVQRRKGRRPAQPVQPVGDAFGRPVVHVQRGT
ncbi:TetR family transcriptional regulator [Streptomyces cellulosae]|uniref:TetR family transcriptional regulator n=1 Tax=Streptomyces cellulosae TaxID=1968 RepID=A0ABW7YDI3_STRCE